MHVDRHPADALMLRDVDVGACDQHAHVSCLTEGGPDLLTVDDPLIAITFGSRAQSGEVGTRARFAEQLAPGLLAGDDVANIEVDLLLGSVRRDCRRRQQQSEAAGRAKRTERVDLAHHGNRVGSGQAEAIRLDRKQR